MRMNSNLAKHWYWLAAVNLVVSFALHGADVTNEPPRSSGRERPGATSTNAQIQVTVATPPSGARIVYKPPLRGAPAVRIDGGSRGSGVSLICLNVLAPDHTGLTVREQPSLFWYQSGPADVPFELTVIEWGKPEPLLRIRLPDAKKYGIQHVNLADHNVKLATGVDYEWVVALVVDPNSRSKDVIASGHIKRVEPSPDLSARLAGASAENLPRIYAEEGLWYDTVETLARSIEQRPDDSSLQAAGAVLLGQVGLTRAAAHIGSLARNN